MPITYPLVEFEVTTSFDTDTEDSLTSDLILQLHTPRIEQAPSALTISVVDAGGTANIVFEIDGLEVIELEPDSDGGLFLATIPVPEGTTAGTHTLTATQGSMIGSVDFIVTMPPATAPNDPAPDAAPVAVPGAVQPNGVVRWVFQDLMPGGLGSWILPANPQEMGSPAFERELTALSTVASEENGGRFHVYEDAWSPVEWTFNGICPSLANLAQLEAYADLNRRFYLHDHRGRVWKVTFQDLEVTPRLSTNWDGAQTEEFHDYQATVLVFERAWVELA